METEQLTLEQLTDLFIEGRISKQELDAVISSKNYSEKQEEIEKKEISPEEEIEDYFTTEVSYNPTDHEQHYPRLTFFFEGIEIGYASFKINPNTKNIFWEEFYPYNQVPSLKGEGLAFGSIAHSEALSFLSSMLKNPSEYTISHVDITLEREEHLSRMGEDKQMTLNQAASNAGDYVSEKGFYSSDHLEKIKNWFYLPQII